MWRPWRPRRADFYPPPCPTRHTPRPIPGVYNGDKGGREIADIPRHDRHAMDKAGRRYQGIANRSWVWHVKRCTAQHHFGIDRQCPVRKLRDHLIMQPCAEYRPLDCVATLGAQHANFQFLQHDHRQKQAGGGNTRCPCQDISVSPAYLSLPQLRNDVRIKQEHQVKSAARATSSNRGISSSISSAPGGMASLSIMLSLPPVSRR